MNENVLKLNIESDAFSAMKQDFDKVLRRTLANMQQKESSDATLTLKLSISLTEQDAPDFESAYANAMRKVQKPRFDHKISSVMQIKTEESGSLKGEYELVWDEEAQDYVVKPNENGQQSLFDMGDIIEADAYPVDDDEDGDSHALPAPKQALPAPDDIGVDGYEYDDGTEV